MMTFIQNNSSSTLHPSQRFITMIGVVIAMFMSALDQTIIGIAMPKIISELNGFSYYAWVQTSYLISSTVIVPLVGKLSDMLGRKFFLLGGVIAFVGASLLCGSITNIFELIFFRALQGLAGGTLMAMAFTTIADLYPPSERGKASGFIGSVFGLSSIVGPALGGFITDALGWRYIFFINLPIGIIAGVVISRYYPHIKKNNQQMTQKFSMAHLDIRGAILLLISLVSFLLALQGITDKDSVSRNTNLLLLCALLTGVALLINEIQHKNPIFPLFLFKDTTIALSFCTAFLSSIILFGSSLYIPLFLQKVMDISPSKTGAYLSPMTLSVITGSIVTGQLISRRGKYKNKGVIGFVIASIGLFFLSHMDETISHYKLIIYLMILGIGMGATFPVYTISVQNKVHVSSLGAATSSLQFIRSIGGTLGTALFGILFLFSFNKNFTSHIPQGMAKNLSPVEINILNNPQNLLSRNPMEYGPDRKSAVQTPNDSRETLHPFFMKALRQSLLHALLLIFLVSTCISLVGAVIGYFIKDVPLRKVNTPSTTHASD